MTVKVWDVPVRVVHWAFVGLLPGLWWTAQSGRLDLHFTLGLVMLGMIAVHLTAILFYRIVRKDDLVLPMITGRKKVMIMPTIPTIAPTWKIVVIALVAATFALWVSFGVPPWGANFPWDQSVLDKDVASINSYM